METFKDVLASIMGAIKDRLGNPLLGTYVITWCLWNFRVLLVLFGEGEKGWPEKLAYLDRALLTEWWTFPYYGMSMPLLLSLIWLYALPPVLRVFAVHHQKELLKTRTQVLQVQDKMPLSQSEATELRNRSRKESERWKAERTQLLLAIDELNAKVETLEAAHPAAQANLEKVEDAPQRQAPKNQPDELLQNEVSEEPEEIVVPTDRVEAAKSAARSLGIEFEIRPQDRSTAHVFFRGFGMQWPWSMTAAARDSSGLGKNVKSLTVFDENTLTVLLAIRDIEQPQDFGELARLLGVERFAVKVAFDHLSATNLINPNFTPNSWGRLFVAWLIREGFELKLPDRRPSAIQAFSSNHQPGDGSADPSMAR